MKTFFHVFALLVFVGFVNLLKAEDAVAVEGKILACDDSSSSSASFYFELTALLDTGSNENDPMFKDLTSGNLNPNELGYISDTLFVDIPEDAIGLILYIAKPNSNDFLRFYADPRQPFFLFEADFCENERDCEVAFRAYPEPNRPGVEFESLLNGEPIDYNDSTIRTIWDFGDGTVSEWPYHLYEKPGEYKICLTVATEDCEDTYCEWVYVGKNDSTPYDSCSAAFRAFPEPNRPGVEFEVYFNGENVNVSDSTVRMEWDFGDGTVSDWPYHLYEKAGDYKVCVTLSNEICEASFCDWVSVGKNDSTPDDSCRADLKPWWDAGGENKVYFGLASESQDSTAFNNLEIEWDFGDGNKSYELNPVHIYEKEGKYLVTVRFATADGCFYEYKLEVYVGDAKPCDIVYVPWWNAADSNMVYFGLETINGDTTDFENVRVEWDFGDGKGSEELFPVHIYDEPGKYLVKVFIELSDDCSYTKELEVYIGDSQPCDIVFVPWWNAADSNTVYFGLERISGDSTDIENIRVEWDFGDGNGSEELSPIHIYAEPGKYIVRVLIVLSDDCSYTKELEVFVGDDKCTAEFKASWEAGEGNKVYFGLEGFGGDTSEYKNIQVLWDFGDGNQSSELYPYHIYEEAGKYLVTVSIFTTEGCEYKEKLEVYVGNEGPCVADYQAWWNAGEGGQVYFGISSEDSSSYLDLFVSWDFGDGNQSSELFPVHTYEKPGEYDVKLVIETLDSCRYVEELLVIVEGEDPNCPNVYEPWWEVDGNKAYFGIHGFENDTTGFENLMVSWYFGDSTESDQLFPVHEYEQPGKYYGYLYILDKATGCEYRFELIILIEGENQEECIAEFEYRFVTDRYAILKAIQKRNPNHRTKYIWEFSDGTVARGRKVRYSFSQPGWNFVCLTVVKPNLCEATYCDSIYVDIKPECNASFEYHVEGMDVDLAAYWLEGDSNATGVKHVWDLGNGDKLEGRQVSYTYKEEGIYQVCLNTFVDENSGCFECKEILVRPDTLPEDSVNTADIRGNIEVSTGVRVSGQLYLALLNKSMQAVAFTNVVSGEYSFSEIAFGTYTLKVISQDNGEELAERGVTVQPGQNQSAQVDFTITTTNIEDELDQAMDLKAYPNPTSEILTLEVNSKSVRSTQVVVRDMMGRVYLNRVWNLSRGEQSTELNLSNLASGVYQLSIIADDEIVHRLIEKRQ